MKKKVKSSKKRVFFNASVILTGLKSPQGGSAKLLKWAKSGKIEGFVSEVVIDETERNLKKLSLKKRQLAWIKDYLKITPAPRNLSGKYSKIVKDMGDIHLLVSAETINADYLVSLDKKHILALSKKIKRFKITSPAGLIKKIKRGC